MNYKFVNNAGEIVTDGPFLTEHQGHLVCGVLRQGKLEGFGFEITKSGMIVCTCYQSNKKINSFELPIRLETNNSQLRQQAAIYLLRKANPNDCQHYVTKPLTPTIFRSLDEAFGTDPHLSALKAVPRPKKRFSDYALLRMNKQRGKD